MQVVRRLQGMGLVADWLRQLTDIMWLQARPAKAVQHEPEVQEPVAGSATLPAAGSRDTTDGRTTAVTTADGTTMQTVPATTTTSIADESTTTTIIADGSTTTTTAVGKTMQAGLATHDLRAGGAMLLARVGTKAPTVSIPRDLQREGDILRWRILHYQHSFVHVKLDADLALGHWGGDRRCKC